MAKVLAKDLAESWGRGTVEAQTAVDVTAPELAEPIPPMEADTDDTGARRDLEPILTSGAQESQDMQTLGLVGPSGHAGFLGGTSPKLAAKQRDALRRRPVNYC